MKQTGKMPAAHTGIKSGRRLLAALVSLIMVIGLLPIGAFADDGEFGNNDILRVYYLDGDNEIPLTYTLSENTFSGGTEFGMECSELPVYDIAVPADVNQVTICFSDRFGEVNYAYGMDFDEGIVTYGLIGDGSIVYDMETIDDCEYYFYTVNVRDQGYDILDDPYWGIAPEFIEHDFAAYVVFRFVTAQTGSGEDEPCTHENTAVNGAVSETCENPGATGTTVCLDCGTVISESNIIPALGHNLAHHEAQAAACTEDGSDEYWSCSECGGFFSDADAQNPIDENSWVISMTGHTDTKINASGANGRDGLCDACGMNCNLAPRLKEGVSPIKTDTVVIGEAYLLSDLQRGLIFEDPEGDVLAVSGGGSGNTPSSTNYYYQVRVLDQTSGEYGDWSEIQNFASALFGATTISLVERTAGTYQYRFFAIDNLGASSADNDEYWTLTLVAATEEELTFDMEFYIGKDMNYSDNGNKYPIIKLWPSDGAGNINGNEITVTGGIGTPLESGYNKMYATVNGGWYVYRAYGYNI